MLDFCCAFKQTMDSLGVRGSELAKRAGRSRNNISDIRNGHKLPNIQDFGMLLSLCEEMRSGFIEEFIGRLVGQTFQPQPIVPQPQPIAAQPRQFIAQPRQFVAQLSNKQRSELLMAIAEEMQAERLSRKELVAS